MLGSLWDGISPSGSNLQRGPNPHVQLAGNPTSPESAGHTPLVKKIVWWRPHGPSAIAPGINAFTCQRTRLRTEHVGLKRITLKVRLDNNADAPSVSMTHPDVGLRKSTNTSQDRLVDEGGMPRYDLMVHLLDVFMIHFGCQYPALSRPQLERDLEQRLGSTLLFNCIASTASR